MSDLPKNHGKVVLPDSTSSQDALETLAGFSPSETIEWERRERLDTPWKDVLQGLPARQSIMAAPDQRATAPHGPSVEIPPAPRRDLGEIPARKSVILPAIDDSRIEQADMSAAIPGLSLDNAPTYDELPAVGGDVGLMATADASDWDEAVFESDRFAPAAAAPALPSVGTGETVARGPLPPAGEFAESIFADDATNPLAQPTTTQLNMLSPEAADFVLRRLIGQGGQGEVWRAWQSSLYREVAVKRLKSGDVTEFLQEAFTAGALDHPNIVPVYDLGRVNDGERELPLLAMKLVHGTPWSEMISVERTARDFSYDGFLAKHLRILIDVCNAVSYAHSKGIIHRDLKPQQVMVGSFGEVFLMDWGLALSVHHDVPLVSRDGLPKFRTVDTATNRCGSPAYMAPEQTFESSDGLGYHTDVYLLGAILFELLSGKPPHNAPNAYDAYRMAVLNAIIDLPEQCPEELKVLVERTLATEPKERPATSKDFMVAIEDYLSGAGKRRESMEIVRHVASEFDAFGEDALNYEQLTLMEQRLGRALQLWAENAEALDLQRRVLALHAQRALDAHDLQLARTLALGIEDEAKRADLMTEVMRLEVERDRVTDAARQKRFFLLASLLLVLATTYVLVTQQIKDAAAERDAQTAISQRRLSEQRRDIQRRELDQRSRETVLAREMSRALPMPVTLRREDDPNAARIAAERGRAQQLLTRRNLLHRERLALLNTAVLDPEPFELVLGEANLALYLSRSPDEAMAAHRMYEEAASLLPEAPEPLVGMGIAAAWAGRLTLAAEALSRAATLMRDTRGPAHDDTAAVVALAAEVQLRLGGGQHEALFDEGLGILEPRWATLSLMLARHHMNMGHADLALQYARPALEMYERAGKGESPEAALAHSQVAAILSAAGQEEAAVALAARGAVIRRTVYGDRHIETAGGLGEVAAGLVRMGRDADAEPLLVKALSSMRYGLGDDHPQVRQLARQLFDLELRQMEAGDEAAASRVVALGSWLVGTAFEQPTLAAAEAVEGILEIERGIDEALASPSIARPDLAARLVLRSAALAIALDLRPSHPLLAAYIDPRIAELGLAGERAALPEPVTARWDDPEAQVDARVVRAYLDRASAAIDWSGELPGVDGGLDAVEMPAFELDKAVHEVIEELAPAVP